MKTLLALLLLVPSLALGSPWSGVPQEEVCTAYATQAMYGASQRMRGSTDEIRWINREMVIEIIEHELGADALYLMQDGLEPEEMAWVEEATLFGWNAMDYVERQGKEMRDPAVWHKAFYDHCMIRTGV